MRISVLIAIKVKVFTIIILAYFSAATKIANTFVHFLSLLSLIRAFVVPISLFIVVMYPYIEAYSLSYFRFTTIQRDTTVHQSMLTQLTTPFCGPIWKNLTQL